jgi:AcrR family transcriptional regulator
VIYSDENTVLHVKHTWLYDIAMNRVTHLKQRLNRQDWIDAALNLLIERGIGAVSVDQLASRLNITRGSFYHHFTDRSELLSELLDYWAEHWTYAVIDRLANLGLDPGTTLLALMRAIRNEQLADLDAPFRAWALHDPMARDVARQVDEARLAFIRSNFEALGFKKLDAETRARLFQHYEMAAPAMFAKPTPELDEQLILERYRLLTAPNSQ